MSAHPTFPEKSSIIGLGRFHFSVRNGKRWDTPELSTDIKKPFMLLCLSIFSTAQRTGGSKKYSGTAACTVFLFFVVDRRVVEFAVRLFFEGRLGAAKAARAEARDQQIATPYPQRTNEQLMQVSIGMVGGLLVLLG